MINIGIIHGLGWDLAIARYQPRPCGQQSGFAPFFLEIYFAKVFLGEIFLANIFFLFVLKSLKKFRWIFGKNKKKNWKYFWWKYFWWKYFFQYIFSKIFLSKYIFIINIFGRNISVKIFFLKLSVTQRTKDSRTGQSTQWLFLFIWNIYVWSRSQFLAEWCK